MTVRETFSNTGVAPTGDVLYWKLISLNSNRPRVFVTTPPLKRKHNVNAGYERVLIKWAVCLDLTSTKGARVIASTKFKKTGKSPKMLLRCLGVELGTSRVKKKKGK